VAAPQGTVGYTYDVAGNRTSMSLPVRGSIAYVYDAANQLTKLTDWVGQSFTFTYAPDGMPASLNRPGGVNTTYGYDGANRLTSVHHDGPAGTIAHFDYTLDANGNRTAVASSAGTESYTLDVLNRLTGVTYPNGDAASYTYDAAGNRLTSTLNSATTNYTYDSAGRLTAAGAISLNYDASGNVVTNGSSSFSWDWAGRLASATVGGTTSTYTYDGESTRVAATSGATTTNYVWDRAASLPLLIDDGTQGYVQTDQGLLEQLGAAASFPLTDALGSVRSVVSPTASVLGTASYDTFGSVRSQTGQSSIFGFTGQQTDSTGLSFLRARYYNPTSGRFLSPDSVQPNAPGSQGYDLYSYVANNPTNAVDPTGNFYFETAGLARFVPILLAGAFLAVTLSLRQQLVQLLAALIGVVATPVEQAAQTIGDWIIIRAKPQLPKPSPSPVVNPCGNPWCVPVGPSPGPAPSPTPDPSSKCQLPAKQPYPADRWLGLPIFCVYKSRTQNIYVNDSSAQTNGYPGNPSSGNPLHFEASQTEADLNRSQAEKSATTQGLDCNAKGDEVDEYPFARTKEGGTTADGRTAQVMCVPPKEQRMQGGDFGTFAGREFSRRADSAFWVLPVAR
jgi:RHS repeat-associated protein